MRGARQTGAMLLALASLSVASPRLVWAEPERDAGPCGDEDAGTCWVPALEPDARPPAAPSAPRLPATAAGPLVFFWGVGCPRCEQARPFLRTLAAERPSLAIEEVEVRQDARGRARFRAVVARLGIEGAGVPTFVCGDRWVVGWRGAPTAEALRDLLRPGAPRADGRLDLPGLGRVDTRRTSLVWLTLAVGLVDGVNPCAMWVLLVLLGLLARVRERRRLLLFGGVFVLMSGVVYFGFMTAWASVFALAGLSRPVTMVLGVVVLAMGAINGKDALFFKKGPSLVIPDRAKPGLYRRMRAVASAASLPAALGGIAALAFVVNLVELGCTLGLPAVYTRALSLRPEVGGGEKLAWILLYNVAYVVPLAAILGVWAVTLQRMTVTERGARVLKAVSGVVLLLAGTALLFAPELLT